MCAVRNRPTPSSNLDSRDESNSSNRDSKWKTIKVANNRIRLDYVLNNIYNIDIQGGGGQEWSQPIHCPFPFHDDSTASFGYSYYKDCFHCFGCSSSGRAVEFISLMENVPKLKIAEQLLRDTGGYDISSDDDPLEDDFDIDDSLLRFSKYLQSLYQKHIDNKNATKQINKVAIWIDMSLLLAIAASDADAFNKRVDEAFLLLKDYE